MKRDRIILLIQPYKNGLMPKKELSVAVNRFARTLLDLCAAYPRLRFNVALPGYILERVDPPALAELKEAVKQGGVEWLCMGYTEPFLSFSPLWLTGENIALGVKVFTELLGEAPGGFAPPFSNWEPSYIDMLYGAGFRYAVVSSALLAEGSDYGAGYWITESTGNSMAVFPTRSYHRGDAPADMAEWVGGEFPDGGGRDDAQRMSILRYMYSLEPSEAEGGERFPPGGRVRQLSDRLFSGLQGVVGGKERSDGGGADAQRSWLESAAAEIDKRILQLQPLRFKDVVGDAPPLGLHYFPSGLVPPGGPATHYFMNYLHCYDQISVMQRKLMEVSDSVAGVKDAKLLDRLKRGLFFAQDVNRFLPGAASGFCSMPDRLWTYGKLIDIDGEFYERRGVRGGVIRLADFLRNGYKSAVMANRALKLYIDHKNGGQVYELDYIERSFNACAAYNPTARRSPAVVDPRTSRLCFSDKILVGRPTCRDYMSGAAADCSDLSRLPLEYTVKNAPGGVRMLLSGNGAFTQDGARRPLTIDKVFGLEKDGAVLSYSYKLGNPTGDGYSFVFAICLPLSLPGAATGRAKLTADRQKFEISAAAPPVIVDDVADWEIDDEEAGVRIEFVTQKKVSLWVFDSDADKSVASSDANIGSTLPLKPTRGTNGTTIIITSQTEIEKTSLHSFTGRISFRKIRMRGGLGDAI